MYVNSVAFQSWQFSPELYFSVHLLSRQIMLKPKCLQHLWTTLQLLHDIIDTIKPHKHCVLEREQVRTLIIFMFYTYFSSELGFQAMQHYKNQKYQGDNFHWRFEILPKPVLIYKASIAKGPLSFPSCLLLQKIYRKTLTELHSDLNLGWLQYYWLVQCIYSIFFSNYLYFIWFLHVSAFVQKKSSIKNIYKTRWKWIRSKIFCF